MRCMLVSLEAKFTTEHLARLSRSQEIRNPKLEIRNKFE